MKKKEIFSGWQENIINRRTTEYERNHKNLKALTHKYSEKYEHTTGRRAIK
jgi:hypothetical protein